jgi:hypothetical protein
MPAVLRNYKHKEMHDAHILMTIHETTIAKCYTKFVSNKTMYVIFHVYKCIFFQQSIN